MLVGGEDTQVSSHHVTDEFVGELRVGYLVGPEPNRRLLTWDELDNRRMPIAHLRRMAAENLSAALASIGIHGQPPALMLSFDGLESSALLAHRFWDELAGAVPGDLVVGVPARDVVIFTGSGSRAGLERVRRAVDRVFFAGGPHLLCRDLLVRRQRCWHVWHPDGAESPGSTPPVSAPPPRSPAPVPAGYAAPPPRSPMPVPASPRVPRQRAPRSGARTRF